MARWTPLGTVPSVSPMGINSSGNLARLPALEYVVIAIDGGLLGSRLSGGLAAWHPSLVIFYRTWWGLRASWASATDEEWLAKITATSCCHRQRPRCAWSRMRVGRSTSM